MKVSASAPTLDGRARPRRPSVSSAKSSYSAVVTRWDGKLQVLTAGENSRTSPEESSPAAPATIPHKVAPPSLLDGVTHVAKSANQQMLGKASSLAQIQLNQKRKAAAGERRAPDFVPDKEAFTKQITGLSSSISNIKESIDTFQPMTAAQRARRELLQKGSSSGAKKSNVDQEQAEEAADAWKEKVAAWKYVRRIEPELPPLVKLPPSEYEPIVRDQDIIKFNAAPEVLARNLPEVQVERLAYNGALREVHRDIVKEMRLRRKADCLAKRKADAFKQVNRLVSKETEVVSKVAEGDEDRASHWLTALVLSSFAAVANEEIQIRKMDHKTREEYVEQNAERLRKSKAVSGFIQNALTINKAMRDPVAKGRLEMLQSVFVCNLKTKKANRHATAIYSCLAKWYQTGTFFLLLKRFGKKIKRIQSWWRKFCMPRLAAARTRLLNRWLRIERADVVRDIKSRDAKAATERLYRPQSPGTRAFIPMEDRIHLHMIQEHVRIAFIENELRARRFMLLPQVLLWEQANKRWEEEQQEWKKTHEALHVIGAGSLEEAPFSWPPERPSYMPEEFGEGRREGNLEILDMVQRCRAHPNGGGYTEIPKKVIGAPVSLILVAQAKKKGNFQPGCDEDHPFGYTTQEELATHGVEQLEELPLDFPEDLPNS